MAIRRPSSNGTETVSSSSVRAAAPAVRRRRLPRRGFSCPVAPSSSCGSSTAAKKTIPASTGVWHATRRVWPDRATPPSPSPVSQFLLRETISFAYSCCCCVYYCFSPPHLRQLFRLFRTELHGTSARFKNKHSFSPRIEHTARLRRFSFKTIALFFFLPFVENGKPNCRGAEYRFQQHQKKSYT